MIEYRGITIAGTGAAVPISATPLWVMDAIITATATATITGANGVIMATIAAGRSFQIPAIAGARNDAPHIDLSQVSVNVAVGQTAHVSYAIRFVEAAEGSPLAPSEIAGLRISVEPEGLAGFADDGPIDVWVNEVAPGTNDFIQATEANKPLCKTNILNGFRVARFDGVSDRISSQYGPKDDLADGFTFAVVFRTTTTAVRQLILWTGDANSTGFPPAGFVTASFSITDDGGANLVGNILHNPAGPNTVKSYSSLTDTANFHIGICTFSGFTTNPGNKTVQMFLDGEFAAADIEPFSLDYAQFVDLVRMGTPGNLAGNFFAGDIAAAAVFARALTQSEIEGLHLFWANKFNL